MLVSGGKRSVAAYAHGSPWRPITRGFPKRVFDGMPVLHFDGVCVLNVKPTAIPAMVDRMYQLGVGGGE